VGRIASSPALDSSGRYLVSFYAAGDTLVYDPVDDEFQNLTAGLIGSHYGRVETYATWSPDGDRIAWRWNEFEQVETDTGYALEATAAGLEVYSFSFDSSTGAVTLGTREEIVTVVDDTSDPDSDPNEVGFLALDWSRAAGSDTLVFTDYIEAEEQHELFTIDLSSKVVTALTTTGNVSERRASWSPDDSKIVFWRRGSGKESKRSGIYTLSISDGALTALGAKNGSGPSWAR
jgi:Tol biopolymer transport system component